MRYEGRGRRGDRAAVSGKGVSTLILIVSITEDQTVDAFECRIVLVGLCLFIRDSGEILVRLLVFCFQLLS